MLVIVVTLEVMMIWVAVDFVGSAGLGGSVDTLFNEVNGRLRQYRIVNTELCVVMKIENYIYTVY